MIRWLKRRLRRAWHERDEWEQTGSGVYAYRVKKELEGSYILSMVHVSIYKNIHSGEVKGLVEEVPRTTSQVLFKDEVEKHPVYLSPLSDAMPIRFNQNAGTIFTTRPRKVDSHYLYYLARNNADDYEAVGFEQ